MSVPEGTVCVYTYLNGTAKIYLCDWVSRNDGKSGR